MTIIRKPDTAAEAHADHRDFVGGDGPMWDAIGRLQIDFLRSRGLAPHHRFVDVACGSLRGGLHFIRYLDPGRYTGVDKHIELVIYSVAAELGLDDFRVKTPHFVISDSFEFGKTEGGFHFGLAQSLFTHLTAADIFRCLVELRKVCAPGCRFYATFFDSDAPVANPNASHSHARFAYTPDEMTVLGNLAGWRSAPLGDWGHPRGQKMIEDVYP